MLLRELRCAGMDAEDAVARGVLARTKVEGKWLYHVPNASLDTAKSTLLDLASRTVSRWFVMPMPWVPAIVSKETPRLTKGAAEALLHELVRERSFGVLGLLTKRNQPYLALYQLGDAEAVTKRVDAMEAILKRQGSVGFRELPDAPRDTENEGWRATVLQHGEFLGLGTYGKWELIGWGSR
jgi:hypothetical protein